MPDRKLELQNAVPARPVEALPARGALPAFMAQGGKQATLASERQALLRELDFYLGRLAELDKIDPYDFTGLKRVYGGHVSRTHTALDELDD